MAYFDRDGNELGLVEFSMMYADNHYRHVALTLIEDLEADGIRYRVSTNFQGIAFQSALRPGYGPMFETMAFTPDDAILGRTYYTADEARTGHDEVVAELLKGMAPVTKVYHVQADELERDVVYVPAPTRRIEA